MAGDEHDNEVIVTSSNRAGRRLPDLVVRGFNEREVLAHAPAMTCDRVHWDTVDEFDAGDLVAEFGMPAYTRKWSDGKHRVWVEVGRGFEARDAVRDWSIAHGVDAVNIRVETAVPFRDLTRIPDPLLPELIAATVDWLYLRTPGVRRQLMSDLDLVDEGDVHSMMYLFVSDHVDRYDADREGCNGTLNLLAFVLGKLRTWPQDMARAAYGRKTATDRLAIRRARDVIASSEGREATTIELAEALHTTVSDLRRREQAISTLSSLRRQAPLEPDDEAVGTGDWVAADDVAEVAIDHDRRAQFTRALMAAVHDPQSTARRAQDPLALAAVYLTFWEDLTRPEVARELEVLPKTASAAVSRVLERIDSSELA